MRSLVEKAQEEISQSIRGQFRAATQVPFPWLGTTALPSRVQVKRLNLGMGTAMLGPLDRHRTGSSAEENKGQAGGGPWGRTVGDGHA